MSGSSRIHRALRAKTPSKAFPCAKPDDVRGNLRAERDGHSGQAGVYQPLHRQEIRDGGAAEQRHDSI